MRKIITLILALLLLLSMTACRSGNNSNEYTESYESEMDEYESPDDSVVTDPTIDETEEAAPTLANMALTDFSFYADGIAWVTSLEAELKKS